MGLCDNVDYLLQVGAGDMIGIVTKATSCLQGHIHMSMRKTNVTGDYIDPSKYLERREMPLPKWVEECDHYTLIWLVSFTLTRMGNRHYCHNLPSNVSVMECVSWKDVQCGLAVLSVSFVSNFIQNFNQSIPPSPHSYIFALTRLS